MILDGYESAISTTLNADSELTDLLTGGIKEFRTLGVSGTNLGSIVEAQRNANVGRIIKPFGLVRGRNVIATPSLKDEVEQYTSTEQTIEVWIVDDASSSKATIDAATDRVYELLQFRPPTGAFQCEYVYHFDARDYDFNGARVMCVEFLVTASLSVSS